jgi:hypothetical protein
MIQDIISAAVGSIVTVLIAGLIYRFRGAITKGEFRELKKEVVLARIDSEACVRTFVRMSNGQGQKFKDILKEERDSLIAERELEEQIK